MPTEIKEAFDVNTMHAHICENCLNGGKEVIWIHDDLKRGDVQAHTCPECGKVQWKKFLVPLAQLPQMARHAAAQMATVNLAPMEYAFLLTAIFIAIFALSWLAIESWKAKVK